MVRADRGDRRRRDRLHQQLKRLLAVACAALAGSAALAQNNPPPSLSSTFPSARPASPALSDPIGRQLNVAFGLAGGLRKEAAEGRVDGERAGQLIEQLHKTLLGARDNATAKDRTPADEVWTRPQSEALALLEEVRRLRIEAAKMQPSGAQFRALQEAADKTSRMFDKLSEASRKRHETAANAVRNIK